MRMRVSAVTAPESLSPARATHGRGSGASLKGRREPRSRAEHPPRPGDSIAARTKGPWSLKKQATKRRCYEHDSYNVDVVLELHSATRRGPHPVRRRRSGHADAGRDELRVR